MDIQERIKQLMDTKGWSEYKLAKEANLPQSTISHLFKRNNAPTYPTIEAICRAFGITMAQFFADEGEAVVLTPDQKELLLLWGTLTQEQHQIVISTMKHFNNNE
ncbi:MAG TPA: helix-turn-helix transcriptional regulator [Desulfitobacterium dehalogenans]|uniref:Helix-turn-helix transcriptional regulator n=1 Tax=Desulfitobacterium dehalogenans TaxID=36854 RepID=A0A7C6Z5Z3_9FIRM|nr:helix-turn-helix transcriptional regulator [Desulfitobacterium dehalogenans]